MQTNFTHGIIKTPSTLEFISILAETGEGQNDCHFYLTANENPIKIMDYSKVSETEFYLLIKSPRNSFSFSEIPTLFTISEQSLGILMVNFDETIFSTPSFKIRDLISYRITDFVYEPAKMLIYFPYKISYSVPQIFLYNHLENSMNTGFIIYGFKDNIDSENEFTPNNTNPIYSNTDCNLEGCLKCLFSDNSLCAQCNFTNSYLLGLDGKCYKNTCPAGTYSENDICKKCHYSCATCIGPLSTNCDSCNNDIYRYFASFSYECKCDSTKNIASGNCQSLCPSAHVSIKSNSQCVKTCPSYIVGQVYWFRVILSQKLIQSAIPGKILI